MEQTITLQFGHFSNFIGAHSWELKKRNIGNDASAHFRETSTSGSFSRFQPRSIMVDFKNTLEPLKPIEKAEKETFSWNHEVDVHDRPSISQVDSTLDWTSWLEVNIFPISFGSNFPSQS